MTQRHHSLHHVGYKINFSIFTGWSNPSLNSIFRTGLLPSVHVAWIVVLVVWVLIPLTVCWVQLLLRGSQFQQLSEGETSLMDYLKDPEVGDVAFEKIELSKGH